MRTRWLVTTALVAVSAAEVTVMVGDGDGSQPNGRPLRLVPAAPSGDVPRFEPLESRGSGVVPIPLAGDPEASLLGPQR